MFFLNDAPNTFHLLLYGVGCMVNDISDSERRNPLPPFHRLTLFRLAARNLLYPLSHRILYTSLHQLLSTGWNENVAAVGFLYDYQCGPLPYVWHHITVNNICWVRRYIKLSHLCLSWSSRHFLQGFIRMKQLAILVHMEPTFVVSKL